MKITRSILIPVEKDSEPGIDAHHYGTSIMQVNTAYTNKKGAALLQMYSEEVGSDAMGRCFRRNSENNGRSWSEPSIIFEPEKTKEGVIRNGESALFLDEEKGAVLHFYNYHLYPENHFTGDVGKYTRIFLKVSYNGGKTFSRPEQLIQKGFNEHNWAKAVTYGKNSIMISFCSLLKTSKGRILLPIQRNPLECNYNDPFLIKYEAGCFIGKWVGEKIEWGMGNMAKVDADLSSRGLCEPTLTELSDGSIMMICRASNSTITHKPGYKWYCISEDGGWNWSEPSILKYSTGENFFSPATGSRLIRNSKNNKLYWIGNILDKNPDGNRPRYPLQIAEVDEEKRAVIKETVTIIEDKQKEDSPFVQFSNFKVYEERETNEFVLIMARIQEISEKDLTSPAYQYRIKDA